MICLKALIFAVTASCVLAESTVESDDTHRTKRNCTDELISSITDECRAAHLDSLVTEEKVKEIENAEIMLSPFIVWDTPELCSNLGELGNHVYCMFDMRKECSYNTTMEDFSPDPQAMKEAVEYLCEQKVMVFEKLNQTELQSCLERVKDEAATCTNNYVITHESRMLTDPCMQSEQYVACMARFNECTGEVSTVFEDYAAMLKPKPCAACAFTAGLAVIIFAALGTVLLQE